MKSLPASFFAGNRRRLAKLVGEGLVVITANGLLQRSNDTPFPFRQDSNFFYLTGLNEANLLLVIDTKNSEEFLVLPKQTEVERFFGGLIDCDDVAKKSDITTILEHEAGWEKIKKLQQSRKKIFSLLAPPLQFTRQERIFTSPARRLLLQKLKRLNSQPIESIHKELIALREIKQPEELKAIEQAIEITKGGFQQVRAELKTGMFEYEIEAIFDYEFKRKNALHGYAPPVIAAGKNATTLHYQKNDSKLQSGDLLLMDVGAEVQGYTADVSRTYSVSGQLEGRAKKVFDAVKTMHLAVIDSLKPGISWQEHEHEAEVQMGKALRTLGLINSDDRQAIRHFFPHATSHSLGLDAHDPCDYTKPLREGMLITVEPGIYIPDEGIGVRIEDDILLTKTGALNLSKSISYQ